MSLSDRFVPARLRDDARGARGTVTGKSGRWSEHVIVHFPPEVLERPAIGDRLAVKAMGAGLAFPGVNLATLLRLR